MKAPMSGAAKSIFAWGIYMIVAGTCFMMFPQQILAFMHFDPDKEPWCVVGASLIAILGYYYIVAARNELTPFFRATIVGRFLLLVWMTVLIIRHESRWEMLFLGLPDQFGSLWTYLELKKQDKAAAASV